MKGIKVFLISILCINLIACSKESNTPDETILKLVTNLSGDNSLFVEAAETSASFSVMASDKPSVASDASWMSASVTSAAIKNEYKIDLALTPNTDHENKREGTITVSLKELSLKISVIQEKAGAGEDPQPGDEPSEHSPWINPDACEIGGNTAWEVALSLGVGWNLGNQMDAYANGVSSETCWGNPPATQALFDVLKSRGFSTVRIPVTWLGHIGEAPEYKIDAAWLERVVEIVEMAEKSGLNVIVNMHHDGADSNYWLNIKEAALNANRHAEIMKEISALWTQIAERFKDKGNFLMFEAFNEIHDGAWGWGANRNDNGKQYKCLNEWNQTFVDAVRKTGGKNTDRWLSVPSYVTNIDLAVDGSMKLPFDSKNRVMVAVHFYEPNDFALNGVATDWGHTGDNGRKGEAIQDEDYIKNQFAKLTKYWVDKGIPVYIGESGPPNMTSERGRAFRNYYLEYLHRAAREAGIAAMYWDNGAIGDGQDKYALFNHSDGTVENDSEDAINAMLTGGTCRDENYNLSVVYDKAPQF